MHLYRSLIQSKLDYGCVVYASARKSYVRMLDPVQNTLLLTTVPRGIENFASNQSESMSHLWNFDSIKYIYIHTYIHMAMRDYYNNAT